MGLWRSLRSKLVQVNVLIEGYAKEIENGWLASSTVTLVESNGKKLIVDPGCNRSKLLDVLLSNNLETDDIDYVLLTHSHIDHALLSGIFKKAKVLTSEEIYTDDTQILHNGIVPETDLKIIQTPGHSLEHCSLVAPTSNGIYVVCGDVFWWIDSENQKIDIEKIDDAHPQEVDMERLRESRQKILKIADFIVPGHGKVLKVEK